MLLRVAAGAVALMVAAAIVSTVALWVYAGRRLEGEPLVALGRPVGADQPVSAPGAVETLVVGVDSAAAAASDDAPAVVTLGVIQTVPSRDEPVLLILPTALEAAVPGAATMPLRTVLGHGGPELLVEAVEGYTGLALDHYVVIDAQGVAALADTVGGVTLCSGATGGDCTRAGGAEVGAALEGYRGDPLAQRRVVAETLAEATAPATLVNPFMAKRVIDAVAAGMATDADLGAIDLLALSRRLADVAGTQVDLRFVPSYTVAGGDVTFAYPEPAETLFQSLREGTALPVDIGVAAPEEITHADVSVAVENGVGIAGLAADAADDLTADGFAVAGTDNADRFGQDRTVVAYAPGLAFKAEMLAEHFPEAQLTELASPPEHDGQPIDVVVTIGEDWAPR